MNPQVLEAQSLQFCQIIAFFIIFEKDSHDGLSSKLDGLRVINKNIILFLNYTLPCLIQAGGVIVVGPGLFG